MNPFKHKVHDLNKDVTRIINKMNELQKHAHLEFNSKHTDEISERQLRQYGEQLSDCTVSTGSWTEATYSLFQVANTYYMRRIERYVSYGMTPVSGPKVSIHAIKEEVNNV